MNTIITYKVVFINPYGDLEEREFSDVQGAQDFAQTVSGSHIYKVTILGSIEEVV